MRFVHAVLFLSVLCAVAGLAATTPAKSTAKKSTTKVVSKSTSKAPVSTAASSAIKKAPSTKAPATKAPATKAPATSHVAAKSKKPVGPLAPRRQLTPSSDRYREIQQALVDKGYLKSEPTGVWDADSVAAMQHFQSDQKQTPTGKITAASLIGLGLGAKTAGAPEAPPLGGHPATVDQSAPPVTPQATSAPAASQ